MSWRRLFSTRSAPVLWQPSACSPRPSLFRFVTSFLFLLFQLPHGRAATRPSSLSAVVGTCPCLSDGPETWLLSVGGEVRWGVRGGRSPSFPPSRCFSKAVRPAPTRGRGSARKEQASGELLRLLPLQGPLVGRVPKPLVRDSPEERDQRDGAGRQAGDAGRSCGLRPSARGRPRSPPRERGLSSTTVFN